MVLNSLQIDPQRLWKGPWRWFTEDMLGQCCTPLETVKKEGIKFVEFACLARCNGAEVESYHFEDKTEDQFRCHIKETCSKEDVIMVVTFSRVMLGQTGDGHFSSLAGYHPTKDLVLVMDVAKFKYSAFWCPVSLLYSAMQPEDKATGLSRGYFILQKAEELQKQQQIIDQNLENVTV